MMTTKRQDTYYRQCLLVKNTPTGTLSQTSWLPEQFAKVGEVVQLRDCRGLWNNGWIVSCASVTRIVEDHLPNTHGLTQRHSER